MFKTKLYFLAVVASIPIQLGKYFFFDHSYVLGIPIDYRAATLYLSDFFIVAFIVSFIAEFKKFGKFAKSNFPIIFAVVLFNIYLVFDNLFFSVDKNQSFFSVLKILEFSLLFIAAASLIQNPKFKISALAALWIAALGESIIVICQFLLQRSLGLRMLGERSFDVATSGIAHFSLFGQEYLRPYGTFPHPNVAGAFLVISIMVLLLPKIKTKLYLLSVVVVIVAAILTFSKSALVALALFAIIKTSTKKHLFMALLVIGAGLFVFLRNLPNIEFSTFAERLILSQAALDLSLKNPAFGIGSGNFILELSKLNLFSLANIRLLQPVHNIFLLLLAENGIFGLLLFVLFLFSVSQKVFDKTKTAIFFALLVFSTFDHYLLTLQQGQMIFFLSLAYLASSSFDKKPSKAKAN